ncbi:tetratricopeptide repeat protein, partial [Planctomycetota bacterium]
MGIDFEIEIVENEIVTNKVIWVQVKATDSKKSKISKIPSYSMKTEHLKYYESSRIPVIIVYGVKKSENNFDFYSLFAQEYIEKYLSVADPDWRDKKTKTVKFESRLNIEDLSSIATKGYLYIAAQQLNINPGGAQYWLDGIPKSDNKELQKRTLTALLYSRDEKHPEAIEELQNILKLCTLSPTERMSVLLNLGNACYSLSRIDEALTNYEAVLELTIKVTEREALEGKSAALGNIGLIYSAKGDLDSALKYLQDAMKIHREIGYKQGEASDLGNIGLIYSAKGDLDSALK